MNGAIARILLRYAAGVLIAKGVLATDILSSDPDVVSLATTAIGLIIAAATEAYYILAKRFGWST